MEKEFKFKHIDLEGEETLRAISEADKFNSWMYNTIKPYCKGKILEIGSGIGNISSFFVEDKANIVLSDIRENYCEALKENFPTKEVLNINLIDPEFETLHQQLLGTFDTVFALNVIEHIFDDNLALSNCHKLLKPQGQVVILVPAYQKLFNRFDQELEHYRRYNREKLNKLITDNNFELVHSQYFNLMGIPGWYVSGKLMKNKTIPSGQMKLYNTLVPAFQLVDKMIFNKVGLSVISVGRKI